MDKKFKKVYAIRVRIIYIYIKESKKYKIKINIRSLGRLLSIIM